jgi:hypothetical protein
LYKSNTLFFGSFSSSSCFFEKIAVLFSILVGSVDDLGLMANASIELARFALLKLSLGVDVNRRRVIGGMSLFLAEAAVDCLLTPRFFILIEQLLKTFFL